MQSSINFQDWVDFKELIWPPFVALDKYNIWFDLPLVALDMYNIWFDFPFVALDMYNIWFDLPL